MNEAVTLRHVTDDDLPIFFEQQCDPAANHMAAFTTENPEDRAAFDAHWARIRGLDSVALRTILSGKSVAGYLAKFERDGEKELTYWLGKEHWGRGVAGEALRLFLSELAVRPLRARAAADNAGSIRVLEKCGFRLERRERGFAPARRAEIDEVVMILE